jgi:hypothetical protein
MSPRRNRERNLEMKKGLAPNEMLTSATLCSCIV